VVVERGSVVFCRLEFAAGAAELKEGADILERISTSYEHRFKMLSSSHSCAAVSLSRLAATTVVPAGVVRLTSDFGGATIVRIPSILLTPLDLWTLFLRL
jgi:hypothetical protein